MASRKAPRIASGLSELSGQFAQERLVFDDIALGCGNLVPQDFRKREMLQQGDNVGKRLVKRQNVGIGRIDELAVHAVEQRMSGFVRDDVLRQAGEDHAAGQLVARCWRRRR